MPTFDYRQRNAAGTTFIQDGQAFWLSRLFDLPCGFCERDKGPNEMLGLCRIDTDAGPYAGIHLKVQQATGTETAVNIQWETADHRLQIRSAWDFDTATGVWRRRDSVRNTGGQPIALHRCLARFTFSPSRYRVYSQESVWCNENRGRWQDLTHATLTLQSIGGRSCESASPYMAIADAEQNRGVVFHIVPRGNWVIHVRPFHPWGSVRAYAIVEMGLGDEYLNLKLAAGESLEFPEILIQEMPLGQPHLAAPDLHRFLSKTWFKPGRKHAPVAYNTWFDTFACLDVPRLRRQLAAARSIGVEVFVIDAGWFGVKPGWSDVGDWREKQDQSFHGRMAEFADEVRSAGLQFGLWMEPERLVPGVPILTEHPEWFCEGYAGRHYPNLADPQGYAWARAEMSRLIETYRLGWMKIDFNANLGIDPSGREFEGYYTAWYRLLDELHTRYPQVFFEGCAGGGFRVDLANVAHHDGHFISDTVNPTDVLRLYQGVLLRLPPGEIGKWIVLRSAGPCLPAYGKPMEQAPATLLTPGGAVWDGYPSETASVDFAARVCLPGMPGLSGDLAGLPEDARQRLAVHIAFYKRWRAMIHRASIHLLTPPELRENRSGWAAFQLQAETGGRQLLFAYRLRDPRDTLRFPLRDLNPEQTYRVTNEDQPEAPALLTGRELMAPGWPVTLKTCLSAAVFTIVPTP